MKKTTEMQGFDIIPEEFEDEIYVRDAEGEFVKMEIPDDEDGDTSC